MSFIEHDRQSMRLKKYDYSSPGMYFITFNTQDRDHLFGQVQNKEMILNEYGRIVNYFISNINQKYHNIEINEFIIMPNHVHIIIEITSGASRDVRAFHEMPIRHAVCTHDGLSTLTGRRKILVPMVVGYIKMNSSKKINILRNSCGNRIWQRNFHDRIIRDDEEFYKIKQYIRLNPTNWESDELNRG